MKRFFVVLCVLIFSLTAGAYAYIPETDVSYFFSGERYGISNIVTNGEIFG